MYHKLRLKEKSNIMRGLMRLLMMFAPMIIRNVMRQQNRRQRHGRYQDRQPRYDPRYDNQTGGMGRRQKPVRTHTPSPPPPPPKPQKTEDEKNFELTDSDIMLDPKIMEDYGQEISKNNDPLVIEEAEIIQENSTPTDGLDLSENPLAKNSNEDEPGNQAPEDEADKIDLDLKNIFFDKDEAGS